MGTLGCRSLPVRLGAAAVGVRDGGGPGLHGRVVGDGGVGAGGEVRPIGGDLGGDGVGALGQSLGQSGDLHRLLPGEGEPAEDLGIDVRLGRRVEGDVQEGAGGGDVDPAGEAEERGESGQRLLVVVDPDVAAVDHAGDEPFAGEPSDGSEVREVGCRGVGEVECQSLDRGLRQDGQGVPEPVEIGGDEQLGAVVEPAELQVGPGDGVELGRGAVLDEGGLVELYPPAPAARRSARTSA